LAELDAVKSEGSGRLPVETQRSMQEKLGHDFSNVRVHTSDRAARLAEGLGARAFTVNQHIVFGAGQYSPQSRIGQGLIAHELVHTQQGNGTVIRRQRCAYGEIRSWAIVSQSNLAAPAGLGDAVTSVEACCGRGQPCSCVDGSNATAPGDQAAWRNISAATGSDRSAGAAFMCVGTEGCWFVHSCRGCTDGRPQNRARTTALTAAGTTNVTGKGTLYFYDVPHQGWCSAEERRTACRR
jgi:hypothetical protein